MAAAQAVLGRLTTLFEKTALNPTIVGVLHLLLTRAPEKVREPLLNYLRSRFTEETIKRIITTLKWLTVAAWVHKINKRLNEYALSNWVWKSQKANWTFNWEIAVVTGGCSGIGKEIVKGLTNAGVKVAVLDIQPLPLDLERNRKVTYVHCDVTSPSSIAEAAKTVRAKVGDPTILVNNAGIGRPHSILDTSNEWLNKIFQINIISHFHTVKEFLPYMIKNNKGHIVGLASMASFVCPPAIVDYGATKAGVMAFHEGLSQEIKWVYKTPGVLNTVVHPFWTATPLVGGYENFLEKNQGKLLSPEKIGKQVVNQILSCRGGQLIMPADMKLGTGLRGHPNWLQEFVRDQVVGKVGTDFPKLPEK